MVPEAEVVTAVEVAGTMTAVQVYSTQVVTTKVVTVEMVVTGVADETGQTVV